MTAARVIDTTQVPWGAWHPQFPGTYAKALFDDPVTKVNLRLAFLPQGFKIPKAERHHHGKTHEGVFVLFGNVPYREYHAPKDTAGRLFDFRQGFLLDRPPRSIHGISVEPTTTLGCMVLEWGTGPLEFNYIPFEGSFDSFGGDFRDPHVANSRALPWQPHPEVAGWKIKMLSSGGADPQPGYHPACLVHVPSGWQPPKGGLRSKSALYRRWSYVVHGDLTLHTYDDVNAAKSAGHLLGEGAYLELNPGAVAGFEPGAASEIGCVLLCVGHRLSG